MLKPKKTKFHKYHRGKIKGKIYDNVNFGEFALQSLEFGWITSKQIEAIRKVITRYSKKGGKLWIRIFPDKPITFRPAETRMGSGKGNVEYWVAVIKPGKIICEISGIPNSISKYCLKIAGYKLPVKTKILYKN
uniref:Large ribosomal subunit protein uL16c n=1 Tax=Euglena longa TaxID=3037 RepID=RK16_EUGLO|nr:ribosomal protein L16 [Euglena longa]P58140.1 RecName: Full=Large ribosomal subunit protein uL16c; AltName: Full=50S ribosomal protein L16, plastid [Euglena longa]CAC24600.1 ribosomal protein L16 [Euglena longa]